MDGEAFYRQTAGAITDYLWQELDIRPRSHYTILSAISGPRVLTLIVRVNPTYIKRITGMSEPLSMAVGLARGNTIRIGRGNRGALALEIPKPRSLQYNISVTNLPRRRKLLLSAGLDCEHRPTSVDLADALTPHVLTAGTTGSGKTNLIRLLAYWLAEQNSPEHVNFILVDTRKRGKPWQEFANLPHLAHPVITDDDTALRALAWGAAEIDRRSALSRNPNHLFIIIDEAQVLLERPEFVKVISDIAATGREFWVHLLLALQNPTAKHLGDTSIKRNLTARFVGRVDSAQTAVVATGQKATGAEILTGAGDMLLIHPSVGVRRLTTALLDIKDTEGLPRTDYAAHLNLSRYEDVEHVLRQADNHNKPGRRPDPLEATQVAYALLHKNTTQRELNRRFSIGFDKAKRVIAFASELRRELLKLTATKCNERAKSAV